MPHSYRSLTLTLQVLTQRDARDSRLSLLGRVAVPHAVNVRKAKANDGKRREWRDAMVTTRCRRSFASCVATCFTTDE